MTSLYICPHTTICESSYSVIYICVLIQRKLYVCPDTVTRLYMCPHTTICVSSYSVSDAKQYIAAYFAQYPGIAAYMEATKVVTAQFTCFTGTKVRILTQLRKFLRKTPASAATSRPSLVLLYMCPHTTKYVSSY